MKIYRFEQDENNGCWYDKNANFHCFDRDLIKHPMPQEDHIYKGVYSSGCHTLEELLWWIPPVVAKRLINQGCVFAVYESEDYFEREHGEVCFNKTNYISREVIYVNL